MSWLWLCNFCGEGVCYTCFVSKRCVLIKITALLGLIRSNKSLSFFECPSIFYVFGIVFPILNMLLANFLLRILGGVAVRMLMLLKNFPKKSNSS